MENMAETTLTRRSFVKASALVGATAAFGASMAGCMQEAPQEQAPSGGGADEGLVRMKTSCHGCIQMCPAIAYLKDGVVVKLEGDPDAPVSRGSLCIKGLNQLHTMYSPRRVLHPLRRAGERGENKWEVISWDEAVEEAATHICDAIRYFCVTRTLGAERVESPVPEDFEDSGMTDYDDEMTGGEMPEDYLEYGGGGAWRRWQRAAISRLCG